MPFWFGKMIGGGFDRSVYQTRDIQLLMMNSCT